MSAARPTRRGPRERSEPSLVEAEALGSLPRMLEDRADAAPEHLAFDVEREAPDGSRRWETVTTARFREEVHALARGLIALGVEGGERIAILAPTRYEWSVADLACLSVGAVVVPLYETAPDAQLVEQLADAGVRRAIVADAALAERVERLLDGGAEEAAVRRVWTMDPRQGGDLAALAALGADVDEAEREARWRAVGLDDLATIVYTSGTSGRPKGARILHRSFVHQVGNVAEAYREFVRDDGRTVIFLPLGHVLARALQMVCLARGMRIAHVADPARAVAALGELRPTFLVVVPKVLERIRGAAREQASSPRPLALLWARAERVAVRDAEWSPRGLARLEHAVFERLFYRRLRGVMGGEIRFLLSGAAPLDPELCRLFIGIGIPVIEGYGLTESTAPLCGARPGDLVPGSVGRPLPGVRIRIAGEGADGEILAAGPGIFEGYEDGDRSAFTTIDGVEWLRTGDLGRLDDEGRLTITGRAKDVIVTSNGRTIQPAAWEARVEREPAVAFAVLIGEGLARPEAVLVLEAPGEDASASREAGAGLREAPEGPAREAALAAVASADAEVPPHERPSRVRVLVGDEAAIAALLTPTQKLRRHVLAAAVAELDGRSG